MNITIRKWSERVLRSRTMKASIGALLIAVGGAGYACGEAPSLPSAAGQQSPVSGQPDGARFYGSANSSSVPGGPNFYSPSALMPPLANLQPPSPVSGPTTLPAPTAPARPMLPAPRTLALPSPQIETLPPATDGLPQPMADGVIAGPFASPSSGVSSFPAMGAWGAGVISENGRPDWWLSADYMYSWLKKGPMPQPLVVTGSVIDDFPGALDQPNTVILCGGKNIDYQPFSAVRVSLGLWGGPEHRVGFEMGGFLLEQKATKYFASGGATGDPFIARPFINAQTGNENVYFVSQNFADPARTALMTGSIEISNSSRMWSWETNGLWNAWHGPIVTANLIGGFRSVGLRERFSVVESLRNVEAGGGVLFGGASVDPGSTVSTFDKFDCENTFYGGQIGARVVYKLGRFSLNLTGKAALGVMQQLVIIDGGTFVRNGTVGIDGRGILTDSAAGGVLAQTTNIGQHFQNKLAVVPEGAADFCFDVTDRVVVKLGYTFVYLNSVVRPGDQIDRTINPGSAPTDAEFGTSGPNRPSFDFKTSRMWMQGVNLGVEFRY